jgi:hypothetical protein
MLKMKAPSARQKHNVPEPPSHLGVSPAKYTEPAIIAPYKTNEKTDIPAAYIASIGSALS